MIDIFNSYSLWVAIAQIILIDILLGGDNAVVIALACRKLPVEQRKRAILWGTLGAIVSRIIMIFFALQLLELPYLKIIGAALLLWIGIKMLIPEDEDHHENLTASPKLIGAIKTIIIADVVMSCDNVVAVASASNGHLGIVVFGILVSIPIIIWGSRIVLHFMDRFPVIIKLGAALLGWLAGTMAAKDAGIPAIPEWSVYAAGVVGALLVLMGGTLIGSSKQQTSR